MKKLLLLFAVGLTAVSFGQSLPNYVPTNGLIGWWPFDSTYVDLSSNSRDAIYVSGNNGNISFCHDRNGKSNGAIEFQSSPSWNSMGPKLKVAFDANMNITSEVTLSVWSYLDSSSYVSEIINKAPDNINSAFGIRYQPNSSDIRFYQRDGSVINDLNSGSSTTYTSWQHIVVTRNATSQKMYINGVLVDSANSSGTVANTNDFWFGQHDNGSNGSLYPYQGKMDDIGIWNRALTPTEIQSLYNAQNCTYIDTVLLSVTDTLIIDVNFIGFNPVQFEHSVKAYPNPAKDHLVMDIPSAMTTQGYSIDIKNSAGQSVFQSQLNQAQLQIDLTTWGNGGLYFLHLLDSNGSMVDVKKIILQ